ncbi:MAG: hypothetical protein ACOCYT_02355 [Chloroflexota bacterium]
MSEAPSAGHGPPSDPAAAQADVLVRAGRTAASNGNRAYAHALYRQAAHLQPKNADIWRALLLIVDNDEDRRVCLENILKLEPDNTEMVRQLERLAKRMSKGRSVRQPDAKRSGAVKVIVTLLHYLIVTIVIFGLFTLGVVLGVLLNLL